MERKILDNKRFLRQLVMYAMLFLAVSAAICIKYECNISRLTAGHGRTFIVFIIGLAFILVFMRGYSANNFYNVVILLGIFMRIWYTLWTAYNVRTHDLGSIYTASHGHVSYITYILQHGALPPTNAGQFYHPPLFHALCAGVLKIFSWFDSGENLITSLDIVKIVPCFASCLALVFMGKICKEIKLSDRSRVLVVLVMAFFPEYLLMSARINNDSLSFLFIIIIMYYSVRWYHNQNISNIICLALGFGLGMMTKINVAIMAIPVGMLFIYVGINKIKAKEVKSILIEYITFILIAAPVGLWYTIRNMILFGQAPGYVLDLAGTGVKTLNGYSIASRFLTLDWKHLLNPIFLNVYTEKNIPLYIIKCSLFGEYAFEGIDVPARLLIICNVILISISLCGMVYLIVRYRKKNRLLSYSIILVWLIWMVSYIVFNIRYPFGCTMDIRYIAIAPFMCMIALGIMTEDMLESDGTVRKTGLGIYGAAIVFSLLSMYCYCSY